MKHDHMNHSAEPGELLHHDQSAHGEHAGHSVAMFRDRFWISLVVTALVALASPMIANALHLPTFAGSTWLALLGSSFLLWYGGRVFIQGAVSELRTKQPSMMTLISLAVVAAYSWSVATTFLHLGNDLFVELTTLITVMLLGHWIEMQSIANASSALHELAALLPDMAERISPTGASEPVPVHAVRVGDTLRIRPGSTVPVDGTIVDGQSTVNEALLTGESAPVEKLLGSIVIAGSINNDGALIITVTRVGEQTTLAGIMRLVADAQASKSRSQLVADRAAYWLTILALSIGLLTLISWLVSGASISFAVERFVAVLVITCPHALGLAVPLVTAISTKLAAQNGILVRNQQALEGTRRIQTVLFDKTGTLTTGQFGVTKVVAIPGKKTADVLSVAAAVEASSEHSLGRAIVAAANAQHITPPSARGVTAIPGQGARGKLGLKTITVGGPRLLHELERDVPPALELITDQAAKQGETIVYVVDGNTVIGAITLADQIRPTAKAAVAALQARGVTVAMVTGDAKPVANSVAAALGITQVFAEVLPQDKALKVKALQQANKRVMMVGDGVNDAAALTQADVGVAIGTGTDVAIASAGIVLLKNDPRDIVTLLTLARASYAKTVQNLVWATGYNVVAIPLAAGVLASRGILLTPAVGAVFMSLSTVIVAINAQLLRRLAKSQ